MPQTPQFREKEQPASLRRFSWCYACFDGDSDIGYYNLMKAWHANYKFDFTFVNAHDITQARDTSTENTIKRSLRTRLKASDILIVLDCRR